VMLAVILRTRPQVCHTCCDQVLLQSACHVCGKHCGSLC
jgi:hypothetical protein